MIIDAQVHAYERDKPERPWTAALAGPPEVTGDDMVAAMDAVGVDGALLVSPWTMYRYDASYAQEVYAAHPGRFAMVKPVDPADAGVADTIADWAKVDGSVAVRIMMGHGFDDGPDAAGIDRVLKAAADTNQPVNLLCWGKLPQVAALAAAHPNTSIIVDHLGIEQPFDPPAPAEPFADLPNVLALAEHDNVTIKITGACTLSHEPFPYNDIWDPVMRIIDAFGIERCMWGTDWTRAVNLLTYEQGVDPFRQTDRLSDSDRAMLMGGSLSKIYGWSPTVS